MNEVKRRETLAEKLDKIDEKVTKKAIEGYYRSRVIILLGMWEKGGAINEDVTFRGVKVTFVQLAEETARSRQHLKKWHELYLKYPDRNSYLPIAEEEAKTWTDKALQGSLVSKMTGNAENYTPKDIIDRVRTVLGGIDLDPASCEMAQETVKAEKYYTQENDGLSESWGGCVFLNPPYGYPIVEHFTDKLLAELPNIEAAILLTNDQTDTKWWQKSAKKAQVICLLNKRLNFYTPTNKETHPTNGQTFFYYGDKECKFIEVFSEKGIMVKVL